MLYQANESHHTPDKSTNFTNSNSYSRIPQLNKHSLREKNLSFHRKQSNMLPYDQSPFELKRKNQQFLPQPRMAHTEKF